MIYHTFKHFCACAGVFMCDHTSLLKGSAKFFSWNTKNTERYGVKKQSTQDPSQQKIGWQYKSKWQGTPPPLLKISPLSYHPYLVENIWTSPPFLGQFEKLKPSFIKGLVLMLDKWTNDLDSSDIFHSSFSSFVLDVKKYG